MFVIERLQSSSIRFGDFELGPQTGELTKDGLPIKLPPQAIQVLTLLAQASGQIITREKIQNEVWGATFVDFDHGLNRCIKQIRAALCDPCDHPQIVETLRGRGYRFLLPVHKVSTPAPTQHQLRVARRSCSISGFKNLSQKLEDVWIAAALSEMFTTELAVGSNLLILPPLSLPGRTPDLEQPLACQPPAAALSGELPLDCDCIIGGAYMVVRKDIDDYIRLDLRVQDLFLGDITMAFSETDRLSNLPELVSRTGERLRVGFEPPRARAHKVAS